METSLCMIPTFGVLTEQQIALINQNSHLINHRSGEDVFTIGRPVSHLIYINTGLIKLHRPLEGKTSIILDLLPSGHFVGLASLFHDNLYPYSATSVEGGELVYASAEVIRNLMAENGAFSVKVMSLLSSRVMFLIDKLIGVSRKQVTGRLAEHLLHLSNNIYKNNTFTLPFSRQELADMVLTTKETISRILTEFKNDKIIDLDDRKVTLRSIELLEILNKIG